MNLCKAHSLLARDPHCDDQETIRTDEIDAISDGGKLNITMLIVGSRGDVQPFIAYALGLQKEGHKVRIATHELHREFVSSWNLEFFPLAGNPRDLMKLCVENDMFSYGFFKEGRKNFMVFIEELLESTWKACKEGTDVIIQNPPAMGGVHIAEKLEIPIFTAFTMPWTRTATFPHPFAIPSIPMGSGYNYSSYLAIEHAMWQPLRSKFNTFREKIGLPPILIGNGGASILHDRQIPHLYCWSPSVLPKPDDWPNYISVTGYWFLDSPEVWKPPEELVEFLKNGSKPIYIGFGSVTVSNPDQFTQIIIDALTKTKQRAILVKGWGGIANIQYPNNVFAIDSVPHDFLFPLMAAVIHHGGAGKIDLE